MLFKTVLALALSTTIALGQADEPNAAELLERLRDDPSSLTAMERERLNDLGLLRNPGFWEPTANPRLIFDTTHSDEGEIWDNEPIDMKFYFTNTGGADLVFQDVKPSCGCTNAGTFDENGVRTESFAPGQRGYMLIVFDPTNRAGRQHKTVTVGTNDPMRKSITLTMISMVKKVVDTQPSVVNFGKTDNNAEALRELTFYGRTDDFDVEFVRAATPLRVEFIKTSAIELDENDPRRAQGYSRAVTYDVILPPGAEVRNHAFQATFSTTDERTQEVRVSVQAQVLGDLAVQPERLLLGDVIAGELLEKEFTVVSKAGVEFNILSVRATGTMRQAEFEIVPEGEFGDAYRVIMRDIPGRSNRHAGRIVVETDRPNERYINFTYMANMRPGG